MISLQKYDQFTNRSSELDSGMKKTNHLTMLVKIKRVEKLEEYSLKKS